MSEIPHLVGMIHLLPLPGAPRHGLSMGDIVKTAVGDAGILAASGFPCLMVENFGDVPFFPGAVPAETIASMTVVVREVFEETGLPIGVNVLRNDGAGALAVAAATGSRFVRVNVLTGVMYTDQGPLIGHAAELLRRRAILCPEVEIWADVMVKHATPPPGTDMVQLASDTAERGLADALILSGPGTGREPDLTQMAAVHAAVGLDTRLVVGSGANAGNLAALTDYSDTVIVGSALKVDGQARNRVDPNRAAVFAEAAASVGLI